MISKRAQKEILDGIRKAAEVFVATAAPEDPAVKEIRLPESEQLYALVLHTPHIRTVIKVTHPVPHRHRETRKTVHMMHAEIWPAATVYVDPNTGDYTNWGQTTGPSKGSLGLPQHNPHQVVFYAVLTNALRSTIESRDALTATNAYVKHIQTTMPEVYDTFRSGEFGKAQEAVAAFLSKTPTPQATAQQADEENHEA